MWIWLSAASSSGAADFVLTGQKAEAGAAPSVRVDSLVQWSYRHRRPLLGWANTAKVIERSLHEWKCPLAGGGMRLENTDAAGCSRFFQSLPAGGEAGARIVYLAAHQTPDALWDLPGKTWLPLASVAPLARPDPGRIVILDACHAAAAGTVAGWTQLAGISVFTCDADELASELAMDRRQPVDFGRRYPETVAWLKRQLGPQWDGRLSFFGFCWLRAFEQTPQPPQSRSDWLAFLRLCEREAAVFRERVNRRLAARVRVR